MGDEQGGGYERKTVTFGGAPDNAVTVDVPPLPSWDRFAVHELWVGPPREDVESDDD